MAELPVAVYSAAQVQELDRIAIEDCDIDGFVLMQRAAAAAFAELRQRWPNTKKVIVLCGGGNNGGDGFLIAKHCMDYGLTAQLMLLSDAEKISGDARSALEAFEEAGGEILAFEAEALAKADVIVDAMLGTGLDREVAGDYRSAIENLNAAARRGAGVLAVDIPSGLSADTGAVLGVAGKADVTVTMIGLKLGLLTGAGPQYAGEVIYADLNTPDEIHGEVVPAALRIADWEVERLLPPRRRTAHKNEHGHLLCVGGDLGTAGAIRMAAEAALRCGAGLVSVATRAENAPVMAQARPELMCAGVEQQADLQPLFERATVTAVGPGLGQAEWGKALWQRVLESELPLVVDADALNLLAANPLKRDNWILTPHPGEAARLLNIRSAEVQADRPAAVKALQAKYGGTIVLKGAGSLVLAPGSSLHVCSDGNPGMAVGGMGDLLTGVVGALLAQGLSAVEAASAGVQLHARAGDAAAAEGERGMLPSDLLPHLRRLANP